MFVPGGAWLPTHTHTPVLFRAVNVKSRDAWDAVMLDIERETECEQENDSNRSVKAFALLHAGLSDWPQD
jgi:hypothetical protein